MHTAGVKSLHPSMCMAVHCSILLHPTSDSHVSSSEVPTAPATSNAGGLEWLVYNPPTTPGGALLAALRLWMINRTRNISPR